MYIQCSEYIFQYMYIRYSVPSVIPVHVCYIILCTVFGVLQYVTCTVSCYLQGLQVGLAYAVSLIFAFLIVIGLVSFTASLICERKLFIDILSFSICCTFRSALHIALNYWLLLAEMFWFAY